MGDALFRSLEQLANNTSTEDAINSARFSDYASSEGIMTSLLLFSQMWPEHMQSFYDALQSRPTVDLASGDGHSIYYTVMLLSGHPAKNDHFHDGSLKDAATNFQPSSLHSLHCVDKFNIENENGRFGPKHRNWNSDQVYFQDVISYHRCDNLEFLRALPDNSVNVNLGMFDISICSDKDISIDEHFSAEQNTYRAILTYELSRVIPQGSYLLAPGSFLTSTRFNSKRIDLAELGFEKIDPKTPLDDEVYRRTQHDASGPSTHYQHLFLKTAQHGTTGNPEDVKASIDRLYGSQISV